MNNMEEKLWDYVDGTCSEEERLAIASLIEKDAAWRTAFNDMLAINNDIAETTLDEPSMAFSYKVMEGIRAHEASKPLKASVSKYIIGAIAGFFILSLLVIILVIFANARQNTAINVTGNVPYLSALTGSGVRNIFFYLDVMLLLFLADAFFRRKRNNGVTKSV
jgi:anti-sigma factor RsiW